MNEILRAAMWMTGSIVSFSSMAVAARSLAGELDTFEIMLFRSIIGMAIVITLMIALGKRGEIRRDRLGLHIARNFFHFAGQNLWFYALTVIPMAQVFAVEFSSPIWVALAAPFFLKERLTAMRMVSAIIGFVGILVVARPTVSQFDPGLIAAAIAAICFAGSAIFTKMLTRDQSIACILFYLTAIQAVFGLISAGYDGDVSIPSAAMWPWILLVACAGLLAHFCLTKALSIAPATIVIPFDFLRLPVIALVGMALYDEPLDSFVILGAAIIFGANYLNISAEGRSRRTAPG